MLIRTSTNRKTALLVVGFLLTSMAVFFVTGNALAQQPELAALGQQVGFGTRDIRDIIVNIVKVFIGFLGLVAVMIVLYGGFLYMTSGGDSAKIEKAKNLLKNGAIGLVIIISAYSIVSFIFRALGIGYGTQFVVQDNGGGEPGGFGGALGNGIIQAHLPARNAVDVPRNTSILVTFKEEMDPKTLINDNLATPKNASGGIIYGNCTTVEPVICDTINDDKALVTGVHALVITRANFDQKLLNPISTGTGAIAISARTTDNKTFVFKPQTLLGNATSPTGYVVLLGNGLKKNNGDPAFATIGCTAALVLANPSNLSKCTDYAWSFEVSTKLDVTPPTVVSVIPSFTNPPADNVDGNNSNDKVARNAIVQINFSEAVNPLTVTGESPAFNLMQVLNLNNAGAVLAGKFEISNQYRTVEFTTNAPCGINSCGEQIFCLPGLSTIQLLIKSPTLAATADLPFASNINSYTGVIDVADNGLNGNGNAVADGPTGKFDVNVNYKITKNPSQTAPTTVDPTCQATQFVPATTPNGDSYQLAFCTTDTIDLIPPQVINYSPVAGAVGVDPLTPLTTTFDKHLSASTVKQDSGYGDGFCGCTTDVDCVNPAAPAAPKQACNVSKGYCEDISVPTNKEKVTCYRFDGIPQCQSRTVTVGTVATVVGDLEVCVEKEHITLEYPTTLAAGQRGGYWMGLENMSVIEGGISKPRGMTNMDHVKFFDDLNYGVRYGSGIKDLFQNCYTPSAAPGCVRKEKETAGQYDKESGQWLGGFPNCDLTTTTLKTRGLFNLSYETLGEVNKTTPYQAWEWDKAPLTLYDFNSTANSSRLDSNDYFKETLKPDTVSFFLYYSNVPASKGYYLYAIGGKYDASITAPTNKSLAFNLSSSNATVVMSAANDIAITPETGTVSPTVNNGALKVSLNWPSSQTDGMLYKIGDIDNFNLAVSICPPNTIPSCSANLKARYVYPGGAIDLPTNKPFSILSVDRIPPVANANNLNAEAKLNGDNYDVTVIWDSKLTDIAEAYVDIISTNKILAKSSLQLNDQGTNGDLKANDNIWSASFTVEKNKVTAADFATAATAAQVQLNTSTRDYAGNTLATSTVLKSITVTPSIAP